MRVEGADGGVTELTAPAVILAAGSVPRTIPGFGLDGRFVLTSDEVLDLEQLPESAVVIGGGAIGCEFASMLADLGTRVTILEALPSILPGVDKRRYRRRGQVFRPPGHRHQDGGEGQAATLPPADGKSTQVHFVPATGRGRSRQRRGPGRRGVGRAAAPTVTGFSPPVSGVEVDERGFVKVDEWMQTSEEGVWAVGDLVATPGLAHVGFAEAMVVIDQLLGRHAVPSTTPGALVRLHLPRGCLCRLFRRSGPLGRFDVVTKKDPFVGNGRAAISATPRAWSN